VDRRARHGFNGRTLDREIQRRRGRACDKGMRSGLRAKRILRPLLLVKNWLFVALLRLKGLLWFEELCVKCLDFCEGGLRVKGLLLEEHRGVGVQQHRRDLRAGCTRTRVV